RLWHHLPASYRTYLAGGLGRRLRHGLLAAHCRDPLECRHMVHGVTGIIVAYADRLNHWGRNRKCPYQWCLRHQRNRLGAGHKGGLLSFVIAIGWFLLGGLVIAIA